MTIRLTPKELVTISEKLGIPEDVDANALYITLDMVCKLSSHFVAWHNVTAQDIIDLITVKYMYYKENYTLGRNIYYDDGNEKHFTFVSID